MAAGRADKFWTPQSPVPSGVWHDSDLKEENTEVLSADRVHAGGHPWVPSSPRTENWTLRRAKANGSLLEDASRGEDGECGETRE